MDIELKDYLDSFVERYNRPSFIEEDPISIPHQFKCKQDREISGLFAALFAWGRRRTILNKCNELMLRMDNSPYKFIKEHRSPDLKQLAGFRHRTFNDTDLQFLAAYLKQHYKQYESLEEAFIPHSGDISGASVLTTFYNNVFAGEHPERTKKHIASPEKNSTCKRINMYLRWMVRKDKSGVDFGIWNKISPADLLCPLDLHVDRTARKLGLLKRKQTDFRAVMELTENLRLMDPDDPVKYDYALFGLSITGSKVQHFQYNP